MSPPTPIPNRWGLPDLGLGLGLRGPHIREILAERPPIGWLEVITDNVLVHQGWLREVVFRLRETYPIVLHGVTLNLGSTDPLDFDYLKQIKQLADDLQVPWVSDHVAWTGVGGRQTHDLLPVPYTEAMAAWMADRARVVQDVLERRLVLENPSSYLKFRMSTLDEWTFVKLLVEQADCGLLLDVNNVWVASQNHQFEAQAWLDAVPWDRVCQLHLAGPSDEGTHLLDTHVGPVPEPVWALYRQALEKTGGRATLLEWDDQIPDLATVWAEASKALDLAAELGLGSPAPARVPVPAPAQVPVPARVPAQAPAEIARLFQWMQAEIVQGPGAGHQPASEHVLPSDRLTPDQRIAIHRGMYAVRCRDALREDFPVLRQALQPARFDDLAVRFAREVGSGHWALEHLGRGFADFLAEQGRRVPAWAVDLARLERARVQAWLAPTTPPLDPQALSQVPPQALAELVLVPAPATQRLDLRHRALQRHAGQALSGRDRPQQLVVGRRGTEVTQRELQPPEAALLDLLLAGQPLGPALQAVAGHKPAWARTMAAEVGQWLAAWAELGLFADIRARPATTR